jgi:hypothetical protein
MQRWFWSREREIVSFSGLDRRCNSVMGTVEILSRGFWLASRDASRALPLGKRLQASRVPNTLPGADCRLTAAHPRTLFSYRRGYEKIAGLSQAEQIRINFMNDFGEAHDYGHLLGSGHVVIAKDHSLMMPHEPTLRIFTIGRASELQKLVFR